MGIAILIIIAVISLFGIIYPAKQLKEAKKIEKEVTVLLEKRKELLEELAEYLSKDEEMAEKFLVLESITVDITKKLRKLFT